METTLAESSSTIKHTTVLSSTTCLTLNTTTCCSTVSPGGIISGKELHFYCDKKKKKCPRTITALVKCGVFNNVSVLKIDSYFNVNVNVTIKGSGDPKNIIETWVRSQQRNPEIIQMCCMLNWKQVSHLSCVFYHHYSLIKLFLVKEYLCCTSNS